jgi:hypothetical protein
MSPRSGVAPAGGVTSNGFVVRASTMTVVSAVNSRLGCAIE